MDRIIVLSLLSQHNPKMFELIITKYVYDRVQNYNNALVLDLGDKFRTYNQSKTGNFLI